MEKNGEKKLIVDVDFGGGLITEVLAIMESGEFMAAEKGEKEVVRIVGPMSSFERACFTWLERKSEASSLLLTELMTGEETGEITRKREKELKEMLMAEKGKMEWIKKIMWFSIKDRLDLFAEESIAFNELSEVIVIKEPSRAGGIMEMLASLHALHDLSAD